MAVVVITSVAKGWCPWCGGWLTDPGGGWQACFECRRRPLTVAAELRERDQGTVLTVYVAHR